MTDIQSDLAAQVVDFELTPELSAFRDRARDYAETHVAAGAAARDAAASFPRQEIAKAGELGLLNITTPTEYGGSDLGNDGGIQAVAEESHGRPASLEVTLPPLSTVVLKPRR